MQSAKSTPIAVRAMWTLVGLNVLTISSPPFRMTARSIQAISDNSQAKGPTDGCRCGNDPPPGRCDVSPPQGRQLQRQLELGPTRVEPPLEPFLDGAQALVHRLAADAQRRRGAGRVASGREVGAQVFAQGLPPAPLRLQRLEVDLAQRAGQQVVPDDGCQEGDVGIENAGIRAVQRDRQRGAGLLVGAAPAADALGGPAEGEGELGWTVGFDQPLRLTRVDAASPPEPGPDNLPVALDREQAAVEGSGELPQRLPRPGPLGDRAEVEGLEVVAELGGVEGLAAEEPIDQLGAAALGGAG